MWEMSFKEFAKSKIDKEFSQYSLETSIHISYNSFEFDERIYRISGIFCVGLIFAEFATSLKSPKIDTAKNKLYYTSSLRVLEIAKI